VKGGRKRDDARRSVATLQILSIGICLVWLEGGGGDTPAAARRGGRTISLLKNKKKKCRAVSREYAYYYDSGCPHCGRLADFATLFLILAPQFVSP